MPIRHPVHHPLSQGRSRRSLVLAFAAFTLVGSTGGIVVDTTTAMTASAATVSILNSDGVLAPGDVITSPGGLTYAVMQGDGNLVIYRTTSASSREVVWHTNTPQQDGAYLVNQGDGNLVIYKPYLNGQRVAIWQSGTGGRGTTRMIMQDDQNLVLINNSSGQPIWSWKTGIIGGSSGAAASLR